MRLIDVDKLKNDLCFVVLSYDPKKGDEFYDGYACGIHDYRRTIERQKIVDAEPVVHGKWLHDESGANYCSECIKYAYEDAEYRMIWHTQYCPHCGAKMDEGREQDEN